MKEAHTTSGLVHVQYTPCRNYIMLIVCIQIFLCRGGREGTRTNHNASTHLSRPRAQRSLSELGSFCRMPGRLRCGTQQTRGTIDTTQARISVDTIDRGAVPRTPCTRTRLREHRVSWGLPTPRTSTRSGAQGLGQRDKRSPPLHTKENATTRGPTGHGVYRSPSLPLAPHSRDASPDVALAQSPRRLFRWLVWSRRFWLSPD